MGIRMGLSPRSARLRAASRVALVALGAVLGQPGALHAQAKSSEAKAVESLRSTFYRALALQDQGRFAEALELLEKVAETRESAQVRFNIAFNQEYLGRLAAAARGYERAIALAEPSGAKNVIVAANARLERLSRRIARLVLRPVGEGVSVSVDGVALAPGEIGRPLLFDVGVHAIDAQGAGRKPYRASLTLAAGETREHFIELEPLRDERTAALPPAVAPLPVLAPVRPRDAPSPPPAPRLESRPSVLPYVAAGAAVLSLATAGVFYALRKDALDTMRAGCDGGRCPDELRSTDERGALYTTAANVALAAGIGLGGVSAGLFISGIDDGEDEQRAAGVRVSVSSSF